MLGEMGLFSLKERRLRKIPSICIRTWWEGKKKREPNSSQQSPLTRQEVMRTILKIKFWLTTKTFFYWGWSCNGTGFPETFVEPEASAEVFKTQLDMFLINLLYRILTEQRSWIRLPVERFLPTPSILWSCDSMFPKIIQLNTENEVN